MKTIYLFAIAIFCSSVVAAQNLSNKIDKTTSQVNRTANSVENAANTAGKILDLGKNLFGSKKKKGEVQENALTEKTEAGISENFHIVLKGVDYENPLFGQIFSKVKSYKGVSSPKKSLEGSEGIISFNFTGDISEIWDNLDEKIRQNFKVEKITESDIRVAYKNK